MLHQFKSLAHNNDHTRKFTDFVRNYYSNDNTAYFMFTDQQLDDLTNHPHFTQVFQDYLDDRKYLEQTRYPNRYDQSIWYDFYRDTYGQSVSPEVEAARSIESCIRQRMKWLFDNKKNIYSLFDKIYEKCLNTPEKLNRFRNASNPEQVKLFKQYLNQAFALFIAFENRCREPQIMPAIDPQLRDGFSSEIGKQLQDAIMKHEKLITIINQFTKELVKALVNSLSQNAVNQFVAQNEATKVAFLNAFKQREENKHQHESKGKLRL